LTSPPPASPTANIGAAAARGIEDPFDAFNAASGQGNVRDPYPLFAEMRRNAGVHRIEMPQGKAGAATASPLLQALGGQVFLAVSYAAVKEVLTDAERFTSRGYAQSMGLVMGHSILEMDGAEHTGHRRLLNRAFTRAALIRWERDLVRPAIDRYIDAFVESGRGDLVRGLCFPFPVEVIAGMIGIPESQHADFHRLAVELISVSFNFEQGKAASQQLGEMFRPLVEERRVNPGADLISVLAAAEVDGVKLDDEQIFAFLRLLAPAGAETTYRSSSNLLFGLLSNPAQLEALREDPSLMPQAIEEGIRWEGPLLTIMRTATCDTKVDGVAIPKGASVAVNLGSANRDERAFEDPERFDIQREHTVPHMGFAFGSHLCLGMHLARMETRVLLEALFERLPGMRLDPEVDDIHITGMVFRSPLSLPVVFEPGPVTRAGAS
jgi:cytochrome P450